MAGSNPYLTPLAELRVSSHQIPAFNRVPNTSVLQKPLLIYHSAFPLNVSATAVEAHLSSVNVVTPQWRYTMYKTAHFHSTAHEILCVVTGKARVCFGGSDNPHRVETLVGTGDVIIIPAGVTHSLIEDFDSQFTMVGSYPKGQSWDLCYGWEGEEEKVKAMNSLGWFDRDPVYGDEGPALHV
ncbi:MAG: hypothetical protein LQ347_002084 [Umbilicaria vellea]|nr:MAG: hypothetical protein LQ347_002084 [Umbilicaria vellea]